MDVDMWQNESFHVCYVCSSWNFFCLEKGHLLFGDDNIWLEHSGLDMEKCHLSSWEDARVGRLVRRQSCVDEICGTVDLLMFVTFVIPSKPFNNHWSRIPRPFFSATFGHLSEDITFSTLTGHLCMRAKVLKKNKRLIILKVRMKWLG